MRGEGATGLRRLEPRRWLWVFLAVHGLLVVFSAAAFFLIVGQPTPRWVDPALWNLAYFHGMNWSGPAYIAAGFAAAWCGWRDAVPTGRGTAALLAVLLLSLGAELLGTATGLPFGPYSYGEHLGPKVLGHVPAVIPLSWFMMLYASLGVAARLSLPDAGTVVVAALGLLAWDVLMDPAMSHAFPFWSWHVEGFFYGMPLVNWGGWILTGLVLAAATVGLTGRALPALAEQRAPPVLYLLNGLLPLALALRSELWGAVAAGGGAMALYLALPLLGSRRRGRAPGPAQGDGSRSAAAGEGLAARARRWLRRRLRDDAFRRRAARFPLTRPAALRSSRRLFRWITGFAATRAVRAMLGTGLLDRLSEGPRSVAELAEACDLPEDGVRRLLRSGRSLGLTRPTDGRWEPTLDGETLASHAPLRAMVEHHDALYRDLAEPERLIRDGGDGSELRRLWSYGGGRDPTSLEEEDVEAYGELMNRTAAMAADAVLEGYDLGRHRRVLDVAGGEGTFLARVADRRPELELLLFELPPVARRARRRLRERGLGERMRVVGGDLFEDRLPGEPDLITLQRVLLDWPDDDALRILRRARGALADGGRILVAEPMLGTGGVPAEAGPYFEMYFLAMGGGRARTPAELARLLRSAGFRRVRFPASPVPAEAGLAVAERRG